jgi:hypothetical protein
MINPISSFLFVSTGSFVLWAVKGFKGSFNDQMVSVDARHSKQGTIRFCLGLSVWVIVAIIAYLLFKKQSDTLMYELR